MLPPRLTKRLGQAQHALVRQEFSVAAQLVRAVLEEAPDNHDAKNMLVVIDQVFSRHLIAGQQCLRQADLQGAIAVFQQAYEIHRDHAELNEYFLTALLFAAEFKQGSQLWLSMYDLRQLPQYPQPTYLEPLWRGEKIRGKTLLLYAVQGLGDTLQWVAWIRDLQNQGVRVYLQCQDVLIDLLSQNKIADEVFPLSTTVTGIDYHAPLYHLPCHQQLDTQKTQPIPYLIAPQKQQSYWENYFQAIKAFKIGIVWSGSRELPTSAQRACCLRDYQALWQLPNTRFFSLQLDTPRQELADWDNLQYPIDDLAEQISDFSDTAAILTQLDLLVTTDTSIVHLAGAMGIKTALLLSTCPDWRWFLGTEKCCWYPSVTLWRQRNSEGWQYVVQSLSTEITKMARIADKS